MKAGIVRPARVRAFLAAVLMGWLAPQVGGSAKELSQAIPEQEQAAIRSLASSLATVPDRADHLLNSAGFSPVGQGLSGFKEWPALRKIETAYSSAVAAAGPEEGSRFLRVASRIVATEQTNAIRYERALAAYLPELPESPLAREHVPVRFSTLGGSLPPPADARVRTAILGLERYVERVPGGFQSVMLSCCGLGRSEIYDILRSAPTRADALSVAIQKGRIPRQLRERLLRAIRTIAEGTHAVTGDPALAPFGVELGARSSDQQAEQLSTRLAPGGGGSASFRVMRTARRGFGDIVFGASVVGGPQTPKPIALVWSPEPAGEALSPEWGRYDVVFADQTVSMTRRVRAEDAFAASEILNGRPDVFPPLDVAAEEGVGLAGVSTTPGETLVHPALFGLSLGDAVVFAEANGFMLSPEALVARLQSAGIPESIQRKARQWITGEHGFYKITDVASQVVLRSGVVRVERTPVGVFPLTLRRTALLSIQAFNGDTPLPESATHFYELVPALAAAFPQFERLNDFAETFALVRWAAVSGARVSPPSEPRRSDCGLGRH